MKKIGFDNDAYMKKQSEEIIKRIDKFGGKLYLEFGGKLFDDHHASRVLPGFEPDSKLRMLRMISEHAEVIITISAPDIEKNKVRGDLGITYDADTLRLIDTFRSFGLYVGSVVITQFSGQPAAEAFKVKMERLGMPVYLHYPIDGYPTNVQHIVSEEGFGKNQYIETSRPLVVVTAPGPGSGKMATCLSQLYHEHKRGVAAGYAKFETFPVWNLPLQHPVNLAYEAATADLDDVNMIDHYHLEAYGIKSVNYNRDVEIFPVLKAMFERIHGSSPYQSPTDMGVNMVGNCIIDDAACCAASRMEILRRYYAACVDHIRGKDNDEVIRRLELTMKHAEVTPDIFPAVAASLKREKETKGPAGAMILPDGRIITGRTSKTLGAASAMLLNALKTLAGIDDKTDLIASHVLEPICDLKTEYMGHRNPRLHTDEVLLALTISALTDGVAQRAKEQLKNLRGSQAHFTVILSEEDEKLLRRLGIHVSFEPKYETKKLYHK